MGISTSSFGGKEELFLAALDHYQSDRGQYTTITVESGTTARDSFQNLFQTAAVELTRLDQPAVACLL